MAAWSPERLAAALIATLLLVQATQTLAQEAETGSLLAPFTVETVSDTMLPLIGRAYVSPDGSRLLIVADPKDYVALYSLEDGLLWIKDVVKLINAEEDDEVRVLAVEWLDNERAALLADIAWDGSTLLALEASTGATLWSYGGGEIRGFKASPGSSYLAVNIDDRIVVLDASTGSEIGALAKAREVYEYWQLLERVAWLSSNEVAVISYSEEGSGFERLFKAHITVYRVDDSLEVASEFTVDIKPPERRYSIEHKALDARAGTVAFAVDLWPGKALVYSVDGEKLGEASVEGEILKLAFNPSGDKLAVLHGVAEDGETVVKLTVFTVSGSVEKEWSGEVARFEGAVTGAEYILSWNQEGSYLAAAVTGVTGEALKIISAGDWSVDEPLDLRSFDTH